ncbi:MAG: CoA-binding protein [Candidatus Anstonellales archaeon]
MVGVYSSQFDFLFRPKSIAVIGASADPDKMGFRIVRNLIEGGFQGPLYPVNSKGGEVLGLSCYSSLNQLPWGVDLAILVIPRGQILSTLQECLRVGIKSAVALTSGFKEIGEEGDRVQKEIESLLKGTSFRLLGPNCAGFINNLKDIYASIEIRPSKGSLSLISQSGSLMSAFASNMGARGLGVAMSISLGNKVNISEADILEYLGNDDETTLIGAYLEDFSEGKKFTSIAFEISRRKPIIVLKTGRTPEGSKASLSHTGALAGEDRVIEGALKQVGVVRAETLDDLYDLCYTFALSKPIMGDHLCILSDAGGPGVIATDAAINLGFKIISPSAKTQNKLKEFLPPFSSVQNPIDMTFTRDVSWYERAIEILSKDLWQSFLVIIPSHFTVCNELAETLIRTSKKISQPLFVSWLSPWEIPETINYLTKNRIPVFPSPERAIRAMSKLRWYGQWLSYH